MGKIIAVCSGSGGVGKTTVALSLAVLLSKAGKRVIFLDASGAARSSDLILGIESVVTLDMMDVIAEQIPIDAALYPVKAYERLRFGCASLYDGVSVSELSSIILALHSMADMLILDMPTGQASLGKGVFGRGDERILVLRPDDASIRSSERLLARSPSEAVQTSLVLNRISRDALKAGQQHKTDVVSMLLDLPVLSEIPEDPAIAKSAAKSRPASESDAQTRAQLQKLAQAILSSAE